MRNLLAALSLAAIAALHVDLAHAGASGRLTIFGGPPSENPFQPPLNVVLQQTGTGSDTLGFSLEQRVTLPAGQPVSFSYDYTLSVQDDGLPAPPPDPADFPFGGCVSRGHVLICPPPYTGFEMASAIFELASSGSVPNMYVTGGVDAPPVRLQTHADSFAESLSQSGTFHITLTFLPPAGIPIPSTTVEFGILAAVWVYSAPIPEPGSNALMAVGIGVIGLAARRRRRHHSLGAN